jgi:hypothetical protein
VSGDKREHTVLVGHETVVVARMRPEEHAELDGSAVIGSSGGCGIHGHRIS